MNLARALNIHGFMSEPELQFLAETASNSKVIVEAGSYQGRSTRVMADNTEGKVYAIDPWDGKYQAYRAGGVFYNGSITEYSLFCANLADHIKSGKVVPVMTYFTKWPRIEADFVFIDAIHEYEALKKDIDHALDMLILKGGILAGHDYTPGWSGVIKAVDEIFPERQLVGSIWYTKI